MAITGSGTQLDPYIVSTLSDLQALPDLVNTGALSKYYAELAGNIDGKNKLAWQTFSITTSSDFDFDLKGYSIKNFITSNPLFSFNRDGANSTGNHLLHNGNILNIKSEVFRPDGNIFCGGEYEDLSISVYAPFHWMELLGKIRKTNRCAINILVDRWNGSYSDAAFIGFLPRATDTDNKRCNLCDIKIVIKNVIDSPQMSEAQTRALRMFRDQRYESLSSTIVKNCRIQGEIQTLANAALNQYPMFSNYIVLENCVVSYGLPVYTGVGTVIDSTVMPPASTGVVNASLVSDFDHYMFPLPADMPRLANADIRRYLALNAAGFDVELEQQ